MIFSEAMQVEILSKISKGNLVIIHSSLTTDDIDRSQFGHQKMGMEYQGSIELMTKESEEIAIVSKYKFKGTFFMAEVWIGLVVNIHGTVGLVEEGDLIFCDTLMRQCGALEIAGEFIHKLLSLYGFKILSKDDIPQTIIEA